MAVNLATLKTELTTDPAGRGYSTAGSQAAADLVNARIAAIGGGVHTTIAPKWVDSKEIVAKFVASEFANLNQLKTTQLALLLAPGQFAVSAQALLVGANGVFTSATSPGTVTALATLTTRNQSRGEFLFGENTIVTDDQVAQARQLP
jgi:hypothetical protein